ncbi:MAG: FMN-binding glutamate synthase family protein [Christensenellales bacterium]|jgi:glutamate synthase domain-containing protein 2
MKKDTKRKLILAAPVLAASGPALKWLARKIINMPVKSMLTQPFDKNMWTLLASLQRAGMKDVIENSLRAESGDRIERPFGTFKPMPSLDSLMFNFAQLSTFPTPEEVPVDMNTVIGRHSARPLRLKLPVMISGIAFGKALPASIKLAMAKASSLIGTAYCTGEGGMLEGDRRAAKQLILQYNRGFWNKTDADLKRADAIEYQFGQGATGGTSHRMKPKDLDRGLRKRFNIKKGVPLVAHARIPGIDSEEDLINTTRRIREITGGVPIGAKIAAGDGIEGDIDVCLRSGLDYIAIDGAEAATRGALPVLLDDFGLPTITALTRAVNHLERIGARDSIDIIISGGLMTPGDFLKAIALGADAVYIGSAALFVAVHEFMLRALPFSPPGEATWYNGKYSKGYNSQKGALLLFKFLCSCQKEMETAVRAMGKISIHQVSKDDLVSIDAYVTEITGIKPDYAPRKR